MHIDGVNCGKKACEQLVTFVPRQPLTADSRLALHHHVSPVTVRRKEVKPHTPTRYGIFSLPPRVHLVVPNPVLHSLALQRW